MRAMVPLLPSLVLIPLFAVVAAADDGVREISQTCAAQTGCFAGDTAGFPVTITSAGSFRLTSSLTVPDAETSGIVITAHGVSIDLNGFEIAGPTVCQGLPVTCTPTTGSGAGITSTGYLGTAVRNGRIRGMRFRGLNLGAASVVEGVRASSTGGQQILVGAASIVRDCATSFGGNPGISTGVGAIVAGNSTSNQASSGISTGSGSTLSGNATHLNGGDGLASGSGSSFFGNLSHSNAGDGIQATASSSMQRNTIRENGGFGIRNVTSLAPSRYRNNTIQLNALGAAEDSLDLGGNTCSTISGCP